MLREVGGVDVEIVELEGWFGKDLVSELDSEEAG